MSTSIEVRGAGQRTWRSCCAQGGPSSPDVRELYEHEAGRIAGAMHIELKRLAVEAGAIDAGRPVVLYCRVRRPLRHPGRRSSGFQEANLADGISAWVEHGLPIEPEGGRVAPH